LKVILMARIRLRECKVLAIERGSSKVHQEGTK
jgi:hypothetical protein